jgi:hypothetical protein
MGKNDDQLLTSPQKNEEDTANEEESKQLTKKDLEIARAQVSKTEFAQTKKQRVYAWVVLLIILLFNISNQWQRFIIGVAYQIHPKDGD